MANNEKFIPFSEFVILLAKITLRFCAYIHRIGGSVNQITRNPLGA
jgi:hypothetical protein